MSVIVEAALSSLFEALVNKLTSSDLLKIFQQEQVHVDLNKWKKTLSKIHAVLDDAEEKRETSRLGKILLDELEELAYDADDILDEFETEVLRRKLNAEPSTSKVRKFIPACCVGLSPSSFMFDANMRSKIADIDSRLQRIVTENNGLDLRGSTGPSINPGMKNNLDSIAHCARNHSFKIYHYSKFYIGYVI
ncbi:putative disease resistance rpp13-like protein 1 [Quercus suber]|uniref:Disease resistance rpp13-like protein 1 n=1 Tax=Quercus suber TaxID=58331 RepID=A0AAW0IMS7_QUESU